MEKYVISGGVSLKGEVEISGAKNAAVAIIPATILSDGPCVIENIPSISDVSMIIRILYEMGAQVRMINKSTIEIDTTRITNPVVPYEMVRHMRASYYLLGALLGKFKNARVAMPGGCDFGVRPIDQHLKGFKSLGADYEIDHGMIDVHAESLIGSQIYFDMVTVGATINVMLAAVRAEGLTIIENAAKEPHIVDLANFLNSMGADIMGAGTDVIKIRGVSHLKGATYSIIPDQIEAGTYIQKSSVKTMPHPGFPTDMQPQVTALLTLAEGTSIVTEGVWDNRFRYVDELRRMGADISVDGKVAVVEGTGHLTGAPVKATDLRAGAALIIAALAADGTTEIEDIYHIERGYEDIEKKLRNLGANIKKISIPGSSVRKAL